MSIGSHVLAERDPDFAKNAGEVLNKRKKVVVYCGRGGTIQACADLHPHLACTEAECVCDAVRCGQVGAQPWAPGRKYFKDDPGTATPSSYCSCNCLPKIS